MIPPHMPLDAAPHYIAVNLAMGAGIAADAMLATIARARTLSNGRDALRWAGAIGLTHWLFPMVGFLGGWYLAEHGVAAAVVYGAGGALLFAYVLRVLYERSRHEIGEAGGGTRVSFWLAVWSVSIDALLTGPGKAAATAHWTTAQVMLSFPFVGTVVFALVLTATAPAIVLHRKIVAGRSRNWSPLARFFVASTWAELLIFTWFAMLSFVEMAAALRLVESSYVLVSGVTLLLGAVMLSVAGRPVWHAQSAAARHMLS